MGRGGLFCVCKTSVKVPHCLRFYIRCVEIPKYPRSDSDGGGVSKKYTEESN